MGPYCSWMRIQCRPGRIGDRALSEGICVSGPETSEEYPAVDMTGASVYMKSIECRGYFCDNLRTRFCTADEQICSNHACTFDPVATCQCDPDCRQFGDCCSNYPSECELL